MSQELCTWGCRGRDKGVCSRACVCAPSCSSLRRTPRVPYWPSRQPHLSQSEPRGCKKSRSQWLVPLPTPHQLQREEPAAPWVALPWALASTPGCDGVSPREPPSARLFLTCWRRVLGAAQCTRGGCLPMQQAAGPRLTQSRAVSLAPSPGPPLPGSWGQAGSGPAHGRREAGVGRLAPFQVRGRGSRSSNLDPARWGHIQVSFLLPLHSLLPAPGGSEVDSHSHATVTRATLRGRPCLAPGRGSSPWALPVALPRPPSHPGPRPRDPWKSFRQLSSLASYVRPDVSSSAGESGGSFHLWKTRLKAIYRADPGQQDGVATAVPGPPKFAYVMTMPR